MMSTIKVINAIHPSGSTNNIVLDASGNATIGNNLTATGTITGSGTLTTTGTVVMGSSFLRNRIINGDMRIDQRNAGASVTPTATATYTLDRWGAYLSQSSKYSVQQVSDGPTGYQKSLKVTSLSAYTIVANDFFTIEQVIEGFNAADFGWGAAGASSVTLSFWVKSSLTGTFGGALYNNGTSSYANTFSYTINAANTWEQKTVTISGPTSSTWNTTNGGAINVCFSVGMSTTYQTAAGSWGSTTGRSVSGAVNVVSTNGATWQVTGVQLEVGSVATPFERRQYGQELALCQRYYEMSIAQGTTAYNTINGATLGVGGSVNDLAVTSVFKVTKRAAPNIVPYSSGTGTANAVRDYVAGADVTSVSTEACDTGFRVYKTSGFTVNRFYGYQWTASSEL